MTTIKASPAAEMHIVCDQNTLFPETRFEVVDETDGPVDFSAYERIWLEVKSQTSGSEVILWDTADNSLTLDIGETDNPENLPNVLVLGEKTDVEMDITAQKYVYNWFFKLPAKTKARLFFGNVIVRPLA